MIRRWNTVIALLVLLMSSCANSGPPSTVIVSENATDLPQLAGFPRLVASYQELPGADYLYQYGGAVDGTSLVLTYDPDVQSEPPEPVRPVPPAFAVYTLSSGGDPVAALEVRVSADNDVNYWLAFFDWQRQVWDFSPGTFPDTAQVDPDSFGPGCEHYVSSENAIAVAIVLHDATAPLTIQYLKLTTNAEVTELTASTDRWDGIMLTWSADDDARAFRVYSRPSDAPEEPWQLLTLEPLGMHAHQYFDSRAEGGVFVDYRVTTGIQPAIYGMPTWHWSPGVTISGKRWPDSLDQQLGGADPVAAYFPANMYNRLSFFYIPADSPQTVEGVSNTEYPPGGSWTVFGAGVVGNGQLELIAENEWPPPFDLRMSATHNNQAITLSYTTINGTYAQIVTNTPEGGATWNDPVMVRPPGQYLLGILSLPKQLAVVTWNSELSRIELRDSIDMYGQYWYEFDPDHIPRQVVGSRRPAGQVELRLLSSGERVTFIEAGTSEIVCYEFKGVWINDSPGITAAAGPTVRIALNGSSLQGIALAYLAPDSTRVKLVRRSGGGTWLIYEKEDIVIAKGGATISEYKLLTADDVSYNNYIVYVIDGQLFMRHTGYAQLLYWSEPILIDDAGGIHELDVIKVGTGDDWSTIDFVTYLSADESGIDRINYRNLGALL
jgi:hypothetical protein